MLTRDRQSIWLFAAAAGNLLLALVFESNIFVILAAVFVIMGGFTLADEERARRGPSKVVGFTCAALSIAAGITFVFTGARALIVCSMILLAAAYAFLQRDPA